ncbi:hypothetical protein LTR17_001195 [Elasticomyces elasticus]|nr:hypothetical protein LTR17_001195 [Elasticomyces elasticus]
MKLNLFATITPWLMIAQSAAAPLMLCSILPSETCPKPECDASRGLYLIPDPSSCTRFIVCLNGGTITQYCPDGMEFSETKGSCGDADKAGCKKKDCEPRVGNLW